MDISKILTDKEKLKYLKQELKTRGEDISKLQREYDETIRQIRKLEKKLNK